jgi:hypothetical protein
MHIWALAALLTMEGSLILAAAAKGAGLFYYLMSAAFLSAAVGAVLLRVWARYLVFALTAAFAISWLTPVVESLVNGSLAQHLRSVPRPQAVLSFVPAMGLFLVLGYCCYVAHAYIGTRERHI